MERTAEGTVVETVDATQKEGNAEGTVVEIVNVTPKEMSASNSRAKHKCPLEFGIIGTSGMCITKISD